MAKSKSSTPKTKKMRATKYTKLAAHVTKELNAKKKALVAAEKRLAKAQQTHQELLSEVARLDMLDRSLRAVNEKTTPPQNIKYVYTYPYWVWVTPTYTVPNNPGYVTQPQWTFTNTPNLPNGGTFTNGGYAQGGSLNSGTSGVQNNGTLTCTMNSNNAEFSNVMTVNTTGSSVGDLSSGSCLSFNSSVQAWDPQTTIENGMLVVDLTTHANLETPETEADLTAELVAKAG